MRKSKYPARSD